MTQSTDRLAAALADRYTIERELGQGGMATVYLAHDIKHDRKVALKVLKPELAAVLGAERFVQEIKTTAALQHPHILPLFDSGQAGGFLYYVMPYIEGETLRSKLDREKQLGIEEAVRITTDVADALDYAHRHGVIHRDIKPENILLHDGRPMLADFGIALAVKEAGGNRLTETGLSLGTPQYMSPEQATGDRQLDARSDVYSLGAVLYEMLAGEPPVTGPNAQAMIAKLLTERPTRLQVVRDTVTGGIDAAVAKALAKTPADRFPGACGVRARARGAGGRRGWCHRARVTRSAAASDRRGGGARSGGGRRLRGAASPCRAGSLARGAHAAHQLGAGVRCLSVAGRSVRALPGAAPVPERSSLPV
jgi:tRNA A-37 threonylcarbamoyl transferase component Bud32